jgi:hypothetical protein
MSLSSILYCRTCQGVVVEEQHTVDHSWREKTGEGGAVTWRGIHWRPAADAHVFADVPAEIADVFKESARALQAERETKRECVSM